MDSTVKKAMVSQPMAGLTDFEINEARERACKVLNEKGYGVRNTFFEGEIYKMRTLKDLGVRKPPLFFLSKALESMSKCDAVYFCKGWASARDCRIEHDAAFAYGLEIIYEQED